MRTGFTVEQWYLLVIFGMFIAMFVMAYIIVPGIIACIDMVRWLIAMDRRMRGYRQ